MSVIDLKSNNYLRKLYKIYVTKKCKTKTWIKYSRKYTAPLSPLQTISIPTSDIIKFQLGREKLPHDNTISHVLEGDWDKKTTPVEDTRYYRSIYDHCKTGVEWENTPLFTRYVDYFSKDDPSPRHGCTSIEEYRDRLHRLDDIYNDIKNNGYKSQSSINEEYITKPSDKEDKKLARAYPPVFDDVTINFSRDGEPILHEGRHRACMAKIIGVDSIPARVFIRHSEWQGVRDKHYLCERKNTHPDIINQ